MAPGRSCKQFRTYSETSTLHGSVRIFLPCRKDYLECGFLVGQRTASDPDRVVSRFHSWGTLQVEEGEFVKAQRESDLFRFSWNQSDALKSFEAAHRLLDACAQVAYVALDNLGGRTVSGVGHCRRRFKKRRASIGEGLRQRNAGLGYPDVPVGEARVGKSVAKGEERAVWDIDVAGDKARVSVGRRREIDPSGRASCWQVVVVERLLPDGAGKAHRELAAGRHISVECVSDGVPGLGSREPDRHDCSHMFAGPVEDQGTAREDE